MNTDLLRKVQEQFRDHPETADMGVWWRDTSCGAVGCINGWAHQLAGAVMPEFDLTNTKIIESGAALLELEYSQAYRLFLDSEWPDDLSSRLSNAENGIGVERPATVICDAIDRFIADQDSFSSWAPEK